MGSTSLFKSKNALFFLHEYIRIFHINRSMKHRHTKLMVCPTQVGHRCALNTSTTRVRHAVLRVLFKKYYLSTWTRVGHNRIWLGHGSDVCRTRLDTAWIRLEHNLLLFFFQLFDGPKKNLKIQKPKFI